MKEILESLLIGLFPVLIFSIMDIEDPDAKRWETIVRIIAIAGWVVALIWYATIIYRG